jgi:hypothetical protein
MPSDFLEQARPTIAAAGGIACAIANDGMAHQGFFDGCEDPTDGRYALGGI